MRLIRLRPAEEEGGSDGRADEAHTPDEETYGLLRIARACCVRCFASIRGGFGRLLPCRRRSRACGSGAPSCLHGVACVRVVNGGEEQGSAACQEREATREEQPGQDPIAAFVGW